MFTHENVQNIIFICTGNTCRSALAEVEQKIQIVNKIFDATMIISKNVERVQNYFKIFQNLNQFHIVTFQCFKYL